MSNCVSRHELDFVAAIALGIEGPQFWCVLVGKPPPFGHGGGTPVLPELGQLLLRGSPAVGGDGVGQSAVERKQIHIDKWRRLVEYLVGRK
jgi:hypothetical protein